MDLKLPKPEDFVNVLNTLYEKSINGINPVSSPIKQLADDYLKDQKDPKKAAQSMLNAQILKCTTSGFITGFGGLITLPVAVPANLTSVLYIQMRMVACTAHIGGYDLTSDQVRTFVYACLAGVSINGLLKEFGVKFGEKLVLQGVKKIPGKVLTQINQKIGFRLITKFGEEGLINIGKMIPLVGAVINGGFDLVESKNYCWSCIRILYY